MITDINLRFSSDQALRGNAVSEDTIDLGVARDIGAGKQLYALFTVGVQIAGGGMTDLGIDIIVDDDPALGSPGILVTIPNIPVANLVPGFQVSVPIPPLDGVGLGVRYLGASYRCVGGNPNAGTITADIVETVQQQKYYPSGF